MWVIFALLDPDPGTQINADPDPKPLINVFLDPIVFSHFFLRLHHFNADVYPAFHVYGIRNTDPPLLILVNSISIDC